MKATTIAHRCGLALASLLTALPAPATIAAELRFQAYIGIPFDRAQPFFGLNTGLDDAESRLAAGAPADADDGPRAELDLRFGAAAPPSVTLNGVPLDRPLRKTLPGWFDAAGAEETSPWMTVAAVVVGVGLIAAIANADDRSVVICSGPDCPPEKPPPAPDADAGQ